MSWNTALILNNLIYRLGTTFNTNNIIATQGNIQNLVSGTFTANDIYADSITTNTLNSGTITTIGQSLQSAQIEEFAIIKNNIYSNNFLPLGSPTNLYSGVVNSVALIQDYDINGDPTGVYKVICLEWQNPITKTHIRGATYDTNGNFLTGTPYYAITNSAFNYKYGQVENLTTLPYFILDYDGTFTIIIIYINEFGTSAWDTPYQSGGVPTDYNVSEQIYINSPNSPKRVLANPDLSQLVFYTKSSEITTDVIECPSFLGNVNFNNDIQANSITITGNIIGDNAYVGGVFDGSGCNISGSITGINVATSSLFVGSGGFTGPAINTTSYNVLSTTQVPSSYVLATFASQLSTTLNNNYAKLSGATFSGSIQGTLSNMTNNLSQQYFLKNSSNVEYVAGMNADTTIGDMNIFTNNANTNTINFINFNDVKARIGTTGLQLVDNTNCVLRVQSGASSEGRIHFGDSSVLNRGRIHYSNATNEFNIHTNNSGTPNLRMSSSGMTYNNNIHSFNNLAGNTNFMTITSNGNIGIGVINPQQQLQIARNVGANSTFQFGMSDIATSKGLNFASNLFGGDYNGLVQTNDSAIISTPLNNSAIVVAPHNGSSVGMRIDGLNNRITLSGNVGIGTQNSGHQLQIVRGGGNQATLACVVSESSTNSFIGMNSRALLGDFLSQTKAGDSIIVAGQQNSGSLCLGAWGRANMRLGSDNQITFSNMPCHINIPFTAWNFFIYTADSTQALLAVPSSTLNGTGYSAGNSLNYSYGTTSFYVGEARTYRLTYIFFKQFNLGITRFVLTQPSGAVSNYDLDLYDPGSSKLTQSFTWSINLEAGTHLLQLTNAGKNPASTGYFIIGLDSVKISS